jgi:long-chain acyl-CoA synthetase
MLKSIVAERRLRDVRLWQRTDFVPAEMLVGVSEILAKTFRRNEDRSRRIAFLLGNETAFVTALLAAMRREDSAVLLNPTLTAAEISDVLKRTTPRLIVTSRQHLPTLRQLAEVADQIDEARLDPFGNVLTFDVAPDQEFLPVRDDEFICQITSGVSGRSRIVSRTYANVDAEIENYINFAGVSDQETFLCPVPLFHAYGLCVGLLPAMATGSACILAPNLLPGDILGLTRFHNPTILLGVPFLYELVAKSTGAADVSFAGYRYLFSAGAPLTQGLADSVTVKLRTPLNPLYGTTETGVVSIGLDRRPFVPGFVGSPLPETNIRIFDEDRSETARGDAGEIGISSLATGTYVDREQIGRGLDDGWFFPGDVGFSDIDGNVYVTGRKLAFINVASLKVDPMEVEAALLGSGLAADCAVVGVQRREYGEFVRAYVVVKSEVSIDDLRAACRKLLAPFKIPREFVIVDTLPRSATGKVLRKYLTHSVTGADDSASGNHAD